MKLFSEYKIQKRKTPLGAWLMPPAIAMGVLFIALIITVFIQFRGKLTKIISKIFCELNETSNFEKCISASEGARISVSLLVGTAIFVLLCLYFLLASSWLRRTSAQVIFPLGAAFTAVGLYLHFPVARIFSERAFIISFLSYSAVLTFCLFWIFFEIVPKNQLRTLKKRWITYWKLNLWNQKDPTILRTIFLAPLKLIYLDAYRIRCFECQKTFFYKSLREINPMALKCENCGFSVSEWSIEEIKKDSKL